MSFISDFKAETSFHTGAIKIISFDYPPDSQTMHVIAQLKLSIDKDIHFVLKQPSTRNDYSWEQPYNDIQIEETDDETKKKILREGRIAEKFKSIPGQTTAIVNLETIELELENKSEVIKPVIDFLKEISFIINLSFRF